MWKSSKKIGKLISKIAVKRLLVCFAVALFFNFAYSISPALASNSQPMLIQGENVNSEETEKLDISQDFGSLSTSIQKKSQQNDEQVLSFSGAHLESKWVSNVKNYPIQGNNIVVNIGNKKAEILAPSKKYLLPSQSTILSNVNIKKADSIVVIKITDRTNIGGIILEEGWDLAGNVIPQYPKEIPLWKSSQDSVGIVEFDPYFATGQYEVPDEERKEKFEVKVNLWFVTENTNASIHKKHDFLEVHTQIYGTGRMQKFYDTNFDSLYEDVILSPGNTHIPFANLDEDGNFVYPWHQYYGETDCIWMAIEFHRLDSF